MKICLTTLGCPAWDLDTIIVRGQEYGFDGIDFRGLLDQIDITILPEFTTDAAATLGKITDTGLAVSGIASSITVCAPETGQLPLAESIRLLKAQGYDGWIMFEHEKRWHPELPEPEVAFPAFVRWIGPLLQTENPGRESA